MNSNLFEGSVDLSHLPQFLKTLNLSRNKLSGTLDLRGLPRRIETVNLSSNQFTGSLDLGNLPSYLCHLCSLCLKENKDLCVEVNMLKMSKIFPNLAVDVGYTRIKGT